MLVTPLVQLPVLLSGWGTDTYGAWLLASALVSFPGLAALSILPAVAAETAMRFGRGDVAGAATTYRSGLWSVAACSGLLLLATVVIYLLLWRTELFSFAGIEPVAVVLLFGSFAIGAMTTFYCTILGSIGRYAAGNVIEAIRRIAELVLVVGLVLLVGLRPLGAACVLIATAVFSAIAARAALLRHNRSLAGGAYSADVIRRLYPSVTGSLVLTLAYAQLTLLGPRILIGVTLGNAAVVHYSVVGTLSRAARQTADLVVYPFQNDLSFAYGRGDLSAVRDLFVLTSRLCIWFGAVVAAGMAVIAPWLIRSITGGELEVDPRLVAVLALALFIECASLSAIVFLISIGRTLTTSLILLFCGTGALAIAVLFVDAIGLLAFGYGVLVVMIVYSVALWRVALREMDQPVVAFARAMRHPPVAEALALTRRMLASRRGRTA